MKKKHGLKRVMTMTVAAAMVTTTVLPTSALAATATTETGWADEIDDMLAAGDYVEGEVLVAVNNQVIKPFGLQAGDEQEKLGTVSSDAAEEALDVDLKDSDNASTIRLITSEDQTTEELLRELAKDSSVLYAEPNYIGQVEDPDTAEDEALADTNVHVAATLEADGDEEKPVDSVSLSQLTSDTNDITATEEGYQSISDLSYLQWGYGDNADGLYSIHSPGWNGTEDNTPAAEDDSPYVVAIMDTGIDYSHPDLKDVMVTDMTKYSDKGGDYGYNATDLSNPTDPMDDYSHGTHCAGIVAASWDGIGTSGVASGVKLCAVKAGDSAGSFFDSYMIRGFQYLIECKENGCNLVSVNCSFGSGVTDPIMAMMANELGEHGVVTCMASGNSSYDNDEIPASSSGTCYSPYVIVVNASTATYQPSDFTEYGETTTHIFAPGDAILSTVCSTGMSYIGCADQDAVVYKDFSTDSDVSIKELDPNQVEEDGTIPLSYFRSLINEQEEVGSVITGESFDGDNSSYKISVDCSKDEEEKTAHYYLVSVPVSEEDLSQISWFGIGIKTSLDKGLSSVMPVVSGNGLPICSSGDAQIADQYPSKVWSNMSFNLQSVLGDGEELGYTYENGRLYFVFYTINLGENYQEDYDIYVDDLSMGHNALRYNFYEGTSMATPAITGAAAQIYAEKLQDADFRAKSADEQALEVVHAIKGMADQEEGYASLCTSNGAFDFDATTTAAVIDSYAQNEAGTLNLYGADFGTKGSVKVNDLDCTVTSWSDEAVTISLPSGLESGRYSLTLTNENSKITSRKVDLTMTTGREVFEGLINLPDELQPSNLAITVLGDTLYAMPTLLTGDDDYPYNTVKLYAYDMDEGTWTTLADYPFTAKAGADDNDYINLTTYDGMIVVESTMMTGYIADSNYTEFSCSSEIWFYDPDKDTWVKADFGDTQIPSGGGIVGTEHGLIMGCGGYYEVADAEQKLYTRTSYDTNIYQLSVTAEAVKKAKDTVKVSVKKCGEIPEEQGMAGLQVISSVCGDNIAFSINGVASVLTWDTETGTFAAGQYFNLSNVLGDGASGLEALIFETPLGLMITGLNGSNSNDRNEDTYLISEEDELTPYSKSAALSDLHNLYGCYNDGKIFAVGYSYFENTPVTIRYTQIAPSDGFNKDENGVWGYYENGVLDSDFTGLARGVISDISDDIGVYYVVNGLFVKCTGFKKTEDGIWRVVDGKVDFDATGVYKASNGWYYCANGKLRTDYTGIQKNENGWWRIVNGKVDFTATGVYKNENGWWYCKNGKVQFNYTGIQKNANGWWRIVKGKVDFTATGVYKNENGWWYCKNGKVQFGYTGIQKNAKGWWRIVNGKVDFTATGVYKNENGWWYCKNGKVDFTFNGLASNSNGTWYIVKGKVQFGYTGWVTYNGKLYRVVNGKV